VRRGGRGRGLLVLVPRRDGDDFATSPELAAFYFDHFQAPAAEEGPLTIIGHA
jgi:hypothetical protein